MEMSKREVSFVLGTVCAVLIFAICIQIKTISTATEGVTQSISQSGYLIEEVLELRENYEKLNRAVLQEEEDLEKIRKIVAKNSDGAKAVETELKDINKKLGLTDLTGQGIIITLDDSKTPTIEAIGITEDLSTYVVHYLDVLKIINELWNAGAEAISVNNQRIVSTTAITCIGNVISINGEKVGAPFVINAIGYPERLYYALDRIGGYVSYLKRDGISVDIKKSNTISIPKFIGKYSSEYMKVNKELEV